MPFTDPPIPSSFTIGNPSAGHETFNSAGVNFYGPDGVTVLFSFNSTTGQLTVGPPSGERLTIDPTAAPPLNFYPNNGETSAGTMGATSLGANEAVVGVSGVYYGSAQGTTDFSVHTGANGDYFTWSMGNLGSMKFDPSVAQLQMFAGALAGASIMDEFGNPYPKWTNGTQRTIEMGATAVQNTDASSNVQFGHSLGKNPLGVVFSCTNNSALVGRIGGLTTTNFSWLSVRNITAAGANVGAGVGVQGFYLAVA